VKKHTHCEPPITLSVETVWLARDTVEVTRDELRQIQKGPHLLKNWPDDVLEQIDSGGAMLVDWEFEVRP
jgi:hypothetical protein